MGSSILTENGEGSEIWPAIQSKTIKKLKLDDNGKDEFNSKATKVILSYMVKDVYNPIKKFFEKNGYKIKNGDENVEGANFFLFPYDWRQDISKSAKKLKEYVGDNLSDKNFILIGHSMGGLVALEYMRLTENSKKVKKIITLGMPYYGSPKMFFSLGYGKEPPIPKWVPRSPDKKEWQEIGSNMPGLYQLLPTSEIYDLTHKWFFTYNKKMQTINETYNPSEEGESWMKDKPWNRDLAINGLSFNDRLDKWCKNSREELSEKTYIIIGSGLKTIQTITDDKGKVYGRNVESKSTDEGDGTVLKEGMSQIMNKKDHLYNAGEIEHLELAKNSRVFDKILKILKDV